MESLISILMQELKSPWESIGVRGEETLQKLDKIFFIETQGVHRSPLESEKKMIMKSHKQYSDAKPQEYIGDQWSQRRRNITKLA